MARRKKEPQTVHRKNISQAAEKLFMKNGIENTTMNDIAREAGYSKATLYVYFRNKEELAGVLVLESMQRLYDYIRLALEKSDDTKERYLEICCALLKYQEEYPFYFKMTLETINVDFESDHFLPEEKESFLIGEKINHLVMEFLKDGIERGDIRQDLEMMPAVFSFWGMISGIILIASNKEKYIKQRMGKEKKELLMDSFELLYNAVLPERGKE